MCAKEKEPLENVAQFMDFHRQTIDRLFIMSIRWQVYYLQNYSGKGEARLVAVSGHGRSCWYIAATAMAPEVDF